MRNAKQALLVWLLLANLATAESVNIAGVYPHIYKVRGRTTLRNGFTEESLAALPGIAGTQASFTWNDLNPAEGVYEWDRLDSILDLWGGNGKYIWVEISTANHSTEGTAPDANQPMPRFIREQIQTVAGLDNGYISPVWWDDSSGGYQELWREFLGEFAARYDGHPAIAGISTGGYSTRHEPHPRFGDNPAGWAAAGFVNEAQYWEDGIKEILQIYEDIFEGTPIMQTIAFSESYSAELLDWVRAHDWSGVNNGFSSRHTDAQTRATYRAYWESGLHIGIAEWGPAGRDDKGALPQNLTMQQMYEGAIGTGADLSRRFMYPFGYQDSEVETVQEWQNALLWAEANIEPRWVEIGLEPIPEPRAVALLGLGAAMLLAITRRELRLN